MANLTLAASPGSFALTGGPATFGFGLAAAPGSFSLTGEPAGFSMTLGASPGVFSLTGQQAILTTSSAFVISSQYSAVPGPGIVSSAGANNVMNVGNLSGDLTTSGTLVTTLNTVNSNVGTFGSSTNVPVVTVNGKGLITAVSTAAISTGFTNPMTTLGDIIYENATPAPARLAGNTTTTRNLLIQTGTGSVSAAPSWGTLIASDIPVSTNGIPPASTLSSPTTGVTSGVASLSWTAVTDAASYVVWYNTTGTWTSFTTATSSTNSLTISGLTNGTTYYFLVFAISNQSVPGVISNVVTGVPSSPSSVYTTYTANGTYTPTASSASVKVLLVGGGGGGGTNATGGGGGAGGAYYGTISVTATTAYPLVVGAGGVAGSGSPGTGGTGGTTTGFGKTVYGGGGGGAYYTAGGNGQASSSGGGGGGGTAGEAGGTVNGATTGHAGGAGVTTSTALGAGGGGGIGAVGSNGTGSVGGSGGAGSNTYFSGAKGYFCGGGGGGSYANTAAPGGSSVAGNGGYAMGNATTPTANTGSGGGGGGKAVGGHSTGTAGAAGVVIIYGPPSST